LLAEFGELAVGRGPNGQDGAVAVRIFDLEADALFEKFVEFDELIRGHAADAVVEADEDVAGGVAAEDFGRLMDLVLGENHRWEI
jgi:hypothetical protein